MAILNILVYPDPRLRQVATKVDKINEATKQLINNMVATMYASSGIGLAATQINVHQRIIVIDISENQNDLLVLINPEIVEKEGEQVYDEGCLSVPDIYAPVNRAENIKLRALDKNGNPFELAADGLLAVCIQHEIDHLDGKVFVDYLSRLKQDRIRKKMLKQQRLINT